MKRDAKQVLTELMVLKAQGGDDRAFRELYELWSTDLLRLAWYVLKERDGVEEVAQDAWVAIAKGLGKLDDPARFTCWAFRIVNRRSVDWIRRRQRERMHRDAIEAEADDPRVVAVAEDGRAVDLKEAIECLDADSRQLLHLFYETGLSVNAIAEVLDVPSGTVKSRLFKLREKLKQYMERK